jgi:putative transposase
MLAAALEAEADAYVARFTEKLDRDGHRLVRRNGHAKARTITTSAGAIEISAPRVDDRRDDDETGEKTGFRSSIVPPWCRKSPEVTEVLLLLYLHGLSTGDVVPPLEGFFGSAAGLSASAINRLTTTWQAQRREFTERDLSQSDYVYIWVDGVHTRVRLEEERLCCLVIVGVRLDGTKELVGIKRLVSRVEGLLVGVPPRSAPPRDAGPDARRGRRSARVLGSAPRRLSGDEGATRSSVVSRVVCPRRSRLGLSSA